MRTPQGFEVALLTAPKRLQAAACVVWAALPAATRIVLARHWRARAWPIVEAVPDLAIGGRRALACYDADRERLLVDRHAVARLPMETLEAIVAHELAHGAGARALDEAEAAAMAAAWGFALTWTAAIAAWSQRRPAAGRPGTGLSSGPVRPRAGRVTARRGVVTEARVDHAGRPSRARGRKAGSGLA